MYPCVYCQASFTARSSLSRHQKRARYCLQARGLESQDYTCSCGKQFSRKDNLQCHQETCTNTQNIPRTSLDNQQLVENEDIMLKIMDKYENMVKELQKQNGSLQKQMVEMSLRPTKVINNVLNNLQPITDKDLQESLDNLELDFILGGAKGYADYAKCYPLKDNVICTDKARKKIKYKDENGEITDDSRMLARRFFQAISERNKDILDTAYKDIHEEIKEIVIENRAGDSDITGLLTRATKLQNILINSQRAATGEDDEFTQEFLNHLAKII
jgi:hypothetical protein